MNDKSSSPPLAHFDRVERQTIYVLEEERTFSSFLLEGRRKGAPGKGRRPLLSRYVYEGIYLFPFTLLLLSALTIRDSFKNECARAQYRKHLSTFLISANPSSKRSLVFHPLHCCSAALQCAFTQTYRWSAEEDWKRFTRIHPFIDERRDPTPSMYTQCTPSDNIYLKGLHESRDLHRWAET